MAQAEMTFSDYGRLHQLRQMIDEANVVMTSDEVEEYVALSARIAANAKPERTAGAPVEPATRPTGVAAIKAALAGRTIAPDQTPEPKAGEPRGLDRIRRAVRG